jgi:hypothetical protein
MSMASQADRLDIRNGSHSSVLAELVDRLTAQMQAGQPIDWDAWLRDHPDHADDLRRLRPALGVLDELSRSGSAGAVGLLGGLGDG